LRREFIAAGIIIVILGTLVFVVSQIPRTKEVETLHLVFWKDIYSPHAPWGEWKTVEVPLEGWTEYKFNISETGVSSPYVNVTDPDGFDVNYYCEGWGTEITSRPWGYSGTYGRFRSGRAGNYTFLISGFVGDPYISLNVFRVGTPREKIYYPYEQYMFLAFALWGIGITVSLVGNFWRKAG
jgi:hypothetical protein